jgi:hypothetical protein
LANLSVLDLLSLGSFYVEDLTCRLASSFDKEPDSMLSVNLFLLFCSCWRGHFGGKFLFIPL